MRISVSSDMDEPVARTLVTELRNRGHEGLLTLVALGCGTGVVPRLVLEHSAVRDRLAVLPVEPLPEPFAIGLCVRRADLRRPLVAALWSLCR